MYHWFHIGVCLVAERDLWVKVYRCYDGQKHSGILPIVVGEKKRQVWPHHAAVQCTLIILPRDPRTMERKRRLEEDALTAAGSRTEPSPKRMRCTFHVAEDTPMNGANGPPSEPMHIESSRPNLPSSVDTDIKMEDLDALPQHQTETSVEKKKREEKEETEYLCTLVPSLKAEDFARYGSLTDFYRWFKELQARQRYHHDVAAYYFMDQMQWRRICKDPRVWASQAWKDSDYSVSEEDEDIRHGDRGEWKIVRENYRILWDWKRIEHEEKRTQFEKERIRLEERERQEWYSIDTADLYVGAGGWDAIWEGVD
ncbi:hypothetical protein B0H11DRAFT_2349331 [Mycena galericulata]|nr:hypothetical protein B0H11DRAFT_2349331 [Mycena galericulata]